MFPINTNILRFHVNNKDYIYIGNYNTILQYSELIDDIISLGNTLSENDIINNLDNKYESNLIKEQISILTNWFLKVNERNLTDDDSKITENLWLDKKYLSSLWLNISNDCNLRCLYCYGSGGSYGNIRKLMTIEKAKSVIDYWFKYLNVNSKEIGVAFFGGEPLMNKKVLLFAVDYINNLLREYNRHATYVLTTNGTILDEELIEFFTKNKFKITISIDGGKNIQDYNRPFVSGKGSFDNVKDTVHTLRQYYPGLLGRLTLTHQNVNLFKNSIEELWNTGITAINYDIVSSNDKNLKLTSNDLNILKEQISIISEITYNNMVNGKNQVLLPLIKYGQIIHNYLHNNKCSFYSQNIIVVDPDGEIFKCHRFADNKDFSVGNVFKGIRWDDYDKKRFFHDKCSSCFANGICTDCAQVHYISNNINEPHFDAWCEHRKLLIEESLKLYVKVSDSNPNIISKFYCL